MTYLVSRIRGGSLELLYSLLQIKYTAMQNKVEQETITEEFRDDCRVIL